MSIKTFSKQPYEEFMIAGEFKKVLATGETLNTPTMTAVNNATGLDSSSDVIESGTVAVNGTQVIGRVKGGTTGQTHKITIKCVTSDSNKWEVDVNMDVTEI